MRKAICAVISLFTAACVATRSDAPPQRANISIETATAAILNAPHALSERSGFAPENKSILQSDPDAAALTLRDAIDLEQVFSAIGSDDNRPVKRFERAILLLGAYPSARGDALLTDWHRRLIENDSITKKRLRAQILHSLNGRYAPSVIGDINRIWDRIDTVERRAAVNYIAEAGRGSVEAIAQIEALRARGGLDPAVFDRALAYVRE